MPTQAELDKAKKAVRLARAENRELSEQMDVLEEALAEPPPLVRRGGRFLAGDAGAGLQGLSETVEIAGPLTLGHVTMGLAFLGRSICALAIDDPHSIAGILVEAPLDGAFKGAVTLRTYQARMGARVQKDIEAEAVDRERREAERTERGHNGAAKTPSPEEQESRPST